MSRIIGKVGKTSARPLNIGDGLEVLRHGFDVNGNHAIWVRYLDERARKIQTAGNLPSVHNPSAGRGTITEEGAAAIKYYWQQYMVRRKIRRHGGAPRKYR